MKKLFSLTLALMLIFSLCACGSSAKYDTAYATAAAVEDEVYYASDYYEADAAAEYGGFAANSGADSVQVQESGGSDINPDKIIYSASAQLETTEFDSALEKLSALIDSCGGFVESSSINGANYYSQSHGYTVNRSASYTIRIPSTSFSSVMSSLSSIGNVPYTNMYTENITGQYYDTQARLEAYKTQETRLLEMMEIAETVEDIITIEDRLTEVRYEIESMQSTLNNWDRKVSYSTLYLDVTEVSEYTPVAEIKVGYGEKLAAAVKNGLASVGSFFADFLLWFVEALPTLIILGAIAWIAVKIIKKRSGSKEERKARREARKKARLEKRAEKSAGTAKAADVGAASVNAAKTLSENSPDNPDT